MTAVDSAMSESIGMPDEKRPPERANALDQKHAVKQRALRAMLSGLRV